MRYTLLLFAWLAWSASLCAAPERPNIVFLLADDLGYRDTGYAGSPTVKTPALDRLAKEGTILDALYVQPLCSPTRAALLTGRLATHTGVYTIVRPHAPWGLPLGERTLATAMKEAGYETAITGKWHLGEFEKGYRPTQRGFDHQYGLWFGMTNYLTHMRDNELDWHRDDQPLEEPGYTTTLIGQEACRLIRSQTPGKPLFLYVPFNAVHMPLMAPPEYQAPYAALTPERKILAGMTAAMDEAIGKIVAALDETGLRKNTVIVFSSDNGGYAPGRLADNTPLRAGKGTIYEGGIRSCGFVSWPGHVPAGQRVSEPVHTVDWFPTLAKLAGASLEQKLPLDGLDIWPVVTAGAKTPHEALLIPSTHGPASAALRMGDWKLVIGASDKDAETADEPKEGGAGKVELYNLKEDIAEKNDLARQQPDKVAEMKAHLAKLTEGAVPPGNAGEAPPKRRKN